MHGDEMTPRHQAFFVTGTDTGVGKTFVTCALLQAFRKAGRAALAMKPVAAGVDAQGRNDDVELLRAASSVAVDRALINPYCFNEAIAPHLAAQLHGQVIDGEVIVRAFDRLSAQARFCLVEGVGGFRVPLAAGMDTADLAVRMGLPMILVVGLRLGCLNHALLTAEAIAARGLPFAGWVANRIDPQMPYWQENLATLRALLPAPLLGVLPWQAAYDPAAAAAHLDLAPLLA